MPSPAWNTLPMRRPDRCFERADPAEHLRQLRARHDAVLHVVVRRHAAHRGERRLAPFQMRARCSSVCATSIVVAPCRRQIVLDDRRTAPSTSAAGPSSSTIRTVSASGKFGCTAASAASDRERVHHLDRGRDDAGADDVGHRGAAGVDRCRTPASSVCTRLGPPQDPHGHLRDDRERAFRADEQRRADRARARRASGPPRCTSSPSGSTASTPST